MAFDYIQKTKNAYRSVEAAEEYRESYTGPITWKSLRFHFIAKRERLAVLDLLTIVRPGVLLDLPCGSGKLATVVASMRCKVVAGDVAAEMLPLARKAYDAAGIMEAALVLVDAERVADVLGNKAFDVAVCLRLMHRVPKEVRVSILGQLARVAKYAVISFGVDSWYLRIRKRISRFVFRGEHQPLCTSRLPDIEQELSEHFHIVRSRWVAPMMSEEIVFLLKAKS